MKTGAAKDRKELERHERAMARADRADRGMERLEASIAQTIRGNKLVVSAGRFRAVTGVRGSGGALKANTGGP
ncbi:MAG TPA: hypothetical protein VI455_05460 [Terriglobia bacterium]